MTIPNTFESLNPSVPEDYGKLPKEIFDKLMTRKQGDRWSLLSETIKDGFYKAFSDHEDGIYPAVINLRTAYYNAYCLDFGSLIDFSCLLTYELVYKRGRYERYFDKVRAVRELFDTQELKRDEYYQLGYAIKMYDAAIRYRKEYADRLGDDDFDYVYSHVESAKLTLKKLLKDLVFKTSEQYEHVDWFVELIRRQCISRL